jgi:ribonuclease-3 family protein
MVTIFQREREETVMHDKISGASLPSSAALAYIGDARHALYVRRMLVLRGITKAGELNELSLEYVTAEAQARAYAAIEDRLLDDEREVFRRAFNSTHLNKPKRASGKDYRTATGFEAVIGMLEWIGDEERLALLLDKAHEEVINLKVEDIKNDSEN